MPAKALMIQGTSSGAGKSLITTGLLRIFKREGIKCAPFKSQNMALNSCVTDDGAEIGRAQVLQAESAGVRPTADMNPILLKAIGEARSQVIVHGRAVSNMTAREYYAFKKEAWKAVEESWSRLSSAYEVIVIEGAGSPAEINLAEHEIVNMRVARHTGANVLLVGDIDRGGVFASLKGTVDLVGEDAKFIKGFIINKFRGDMAILAPGLDMIKKLTGVPVIGVLPYVKAHGLSEEDGLALSSGGRNSGAVRIAVVRLGAISNFTDFDPLLREPGVGVAFTDNPSEIETSDIVIIPGSKNTMRDLLLLREGGIEEAIKRAAARGIPVIGVCGGFQMLGKKISDPMGVEGEQREVKGIGLLDIETVFEPVKVASQCRAEAVGGGFGAGTLDGYEIHMGRSMGEMGLFKVKRLAPPAGEPEIFLDGSMKGSVWGTYLHGIFDNDSLRDAILNPVFLKKGIPRDGGLRYKEFKEKALDDWADMLSENLDMNFIRGLL